jgi:hypothetical protein
MIEKIIEFKRKVEELKNSKLPDGYADPENATLCKLLVVANVAEMCIRSNTKIEECLRPYFDGQTFVARFYGDLGYGWIVDDYYEITQFAKSALFSN